MAEQEWSVEEWANEAVVVWVEGVLAVECGPYFKATMEQRARLANRPRPYSNTAGPFDKI